MAQIIIDKGLMTELNENFIDSVVLGDAFDIGKGLFGAIFDLIYCDPPFFTKRDHLGKNAFAFTDRWSGGVESDRREYLDWLEARIRVLRPLLKPTGVFLLHLDWHAVHYAKVLCDGIFGDERFQNELIWYYQTGGASKERFSRKHDTILFYSMGEEFYFDGPAIAIPRTAKAMKRAQCATGARIKASDTHKNPDDVLTVAALNPMAVERTGYPTHKPVELLSLLITRFVRRRGWWGIFFAGAGRRWWRRSVWGGSILVWTRIRRRLNWRKHVWRRNRWSSATFGGARGERGSWGALRCDGAKLGGIFLLGRGVGIVVRAFGLQ